MKCKICKKEIVFLNIHFGDIFKRICGDCRDVLMEIEAERSVKRQWKITKEHRKYVEKYLKCDAE